MMQPFPPPAPVTAGPVQAPRSRPTRDPNPGAARQFDEALTQARQGLDRHPATPAATDDDAAATKAVAVDDGELGAPTDDEVGGDTIAVAGAAAASAGDIEDSAPARPTVVGGLAGAGPTTGGVMVVSDPPVDDAGRSDDSQRDVDAERMADRPDTGSPLERPLDGILRNAMLGRSSGVRMPHPGDPAPALGGPAGIAGTGHPDGRSDAPPADRARPLEQAVVDAVHALEPGTHGRVVAGAVTDLVGASVRVPDPLLGQGGVAIGTHGVVESGGLTGPPAGAQPQSSVVSSPSSDQEAAASIVDQLEGETAAPPTGGAAETHLDEPAASEADASTVDGFAELDGPDFGRIDARGATSSAEPAAQRRVAQLVERIEQWVDRVRSAPPPNVMTLRPDGQDGYAIRIALESGALHVTVDGAQPDEVAWIRQALEQLARRGMDLGGFEASHSRDGQRWSDDGTDSHPIPGAPGRGVEQRGLGSLDGERRPMRADDGVLL